MLGADDIYETKINPVDLKTLEDMTAPRDWDYARFRHILISLGTLYPGNYFPATNRPETIDTSGLGPFMRSLRMATNKFGVEYGQAALVDRGWKKLIMGRVKGGTRDRVPIDCLPQPGREMFQRAIGAFHVHPDDEFSQHGFSDTDYEGFLVPKQLVFDGVIWRDNLFLALKTSATPKLSKESAERRVRDALEEVGPLDTMLKVVDFNKAVCRNTGLTLYVGPSSGGVARRVNVV